jgi:hypothetical protein
MPTERGDEVHFFSADLASESEAMSRRRFRDDAAIVCDQIQFAVPSKRHSGEDVLNSKQTRDEGSA